MADLGVRLQYGGYLLRSLMELRVAVLLDLWQIPWQYEPMSITTPVGRYVPDFKLQPTEAAPWVPDWIEVKGADVLQAASAALGLPAWGAAWKQGERWKATRPGQKRAGFGIVSDVEQPDMRLPGLAPLVKPAALATTGCRVWVVGNPKTNSLVVRFKEERARVDRDCELYRPEDAGMGYLIDRADAVIRTLRGEVPRGGSTA